MRTRLRLFLKNRFFETNTETFFKCDNKFRLWLRIFTRMDISKGARQKLLSCGTVHKYNKTHSTYMVWVVDISLIGEVDGPPKIGMVGFCGKGPVVPSIHFNEKSEMPLKHILLMSKSKIHLTMIVVLCKIYYTLDRSQSLF